MLYLTVYDTILSSKVSVHLVYSFMIQAVMASDRLFAYIHQDSREDARSFLQQKQKGRMSMGKRMRGTIAQNLDAQERISLAMEDAALLEGMEFNLSDFALFLSVMKHKSAHENILSIIMGEPDLELTEVHVEEVVLNKSGQRAIRLDAWAQDRKKRYFATEMQNDTSEDDQKRRSRYYQSLLDTPLLKSGKETRYRQLPSTVITFITQKDIFGKDLAKYTFRERCDEVSDLYLEDGTTKIFLNMSSKNGDPALVSLLQYMKNTRLDNPEISVQDDRILALDAVVSEVKQSEEWEAVKLSILSVGMEMGQKRGIEVGERRGLEIGEKRGLEIGEKRGLEIGEKRGLEIGQKRGFEIGEKRGFEIGEKKGLEIGEKKGLEIGQKKGIWLAKQIFRRASEGRSSGEIAAELGLTEAEVKEILE